jgi:cytochrome c5
LQVAAMMQKTRVVRLPVARMASALLGIAVAGWIAPIHAATQTSERSGKQIVDSACVACHGQGVNGAPRIGDRKAWATRASQGLSSLTQHALDGIRRMPAHGGNPDLTDREIQRAVVYMVNQSGGQWTEPVDRSRLPAERSGEGIVQTQCLKCHGTGVGGAPAVGDRPAWIPRVKQGLDSLVRSAINGHGGMPPRGGMADLTDAEFRSAIVYMFNASTTAPTASRVSRATGGREFRIVGETTIYFGVVPSSVIRDHPKEYPASVASAAPPVPDQYYVTVALFDANSGQRVTDAVVKARVGSSARSGPEKTLEPATIADSPTYGNYFAMAGADRYTIALRIQRPGTSEAIRTQFDYTHR